MITFTTVMGKKESHFNSKIIAKLKSKPLDSASELVAKIVAGDRKALAQGITAIESRGRSDNQRAEEIIALCMSHSGKSVRIGITGVPGVGKSTFIERYGLQWIAQGNRVAVLAIDPTSQMSKGSILGDKTRMNLLSRESNAFIRPSPAADSLGGVAQKTREAILLCEAAGFDVILIETVGVGQSEVAVHSMVDCFVLLMLAGAGDELQGIKRGIMEMADIVAINKSDGNNRTMAAKAKSALKNALHLFPPRDSQWVVPVHAISSVEGNGIEALQSSVDEFISLLKDKNIFEEKRKEQAAFWLKKTIQDKLESRFYENEKVKGLWKTIEQQVVDGTLDPFQGARQLLDLL